MSDTETPLAARGAIVVQSDHHVMTAGCNGARELRKEGPKLALVVTWLPTFRGRALIITSTVLGGSKFLILLIVQWALKPYANYFGPLRLAPWSRAALLIISTHCSSAFGTAVKVLMMQRIAARVIKFRTSPSSCVPTFGCQRDRSFASKSRLFPEHE